MPPLPTTRVEVDGRECTQCLTFKPWSQFSPEKNQKSGYHSACKICKRMSGASYYQRHAYWVKMRTTSANMTGERKSNFDAYQKKYVRDRTAKKASRPKPSLCEICGRDGKTHSRGGNKNGGVVYDHDHDTGKFRGWICSYCNVAIGLMEESTEYLQKLIKYLEDSKKLNMESAI